MLPDKLKELPTAVAVDSRFADAVIGGHDDHNELTLFIAPSRIVDVCRYLKSEPRHRHTRVVLTAGLLEPFDENEAKSAGADAILKTQVSLQASLA